MFDGFSLVNLKKKIIYKVKECQIFKWKFTVEKNWRSRDLDFSSLKNSPPDKVFLCGSSSRWYHWIFKLLVAT